ncbi:MAG: TonB-dependent receptor [Bacteroidetes bacterium]|nr:TonB-dependent receptor [Bacteroidota bacterium]MBL7105194.1 TonB-dependent receptor [Bacteroidales bacterium]
MKIKIFSTVILLFMILSDLYSQEIHGYVYELDKNKKEVAIPGVNVYWENTSKGISTNAEGHFELMYPEKANQDHYNLVISFIGYKNDTLLIERKQLKKKKNDGDNDDHEHLKIILSLNMELQEIEIISKASGTHYSRINPILTSEITGAELQKAACCNLSESFETNASVDVSYSDAISGAKQIKLLGLAGMYSQILIENLPNLRGLATSYGLGYIPGNWMESIQISKGTSSVKNGYESISGQINVEFKKPDSDEKFFFNTYINNFGKLEGNINSAVKVNDNWSTILLVHGENLQNKIDNNGDNFLDIPLMKQYNVLNRWKYTGHKNIKGQFGIKILEEKRSGGEIDFENFMDVQNTDYYGFDINTKRYELFTKSAYLFNRSHTNIALVQSFIHHRQNSFFGLNNYDGIEDYYYANLMFQSYIGNTNHTFTTGLSYVYDNYDESLNDSLFSRKEIVPGSFFEYTYKNHDKLTVILSMRADFHNIYGTFLTPRFHFKYNLNESTILRGSAGKGYRTPNVIADNNFLLISSRKLNISNDLKMEEAWNYGINLTKYFKISSRELTFNIEFYRTDFVNQAIIDRDQDIKSIYIYNLNGKSYSNSYQIEASYELFKGFDILAAFRYNDVKMTINNELVRKPLVNKYKGLINLSYATNLNKWQFDFTTQFNGDSRIPSTEGNPEMYRRDTESPAYTIINAQITKYFKKWEIYIGGENLTNFKQDDPIIAADDPFGEYFDSSLVWGPILGKKIYAGIRIRIN